MRYIIKQIWILIFLSSLSISYGQLNPKKKIKNDNRKLRPIKKVKSDFEGFKQGSLSRIPDEKWLPYGGVFTPKGHIHALFIFVGIDEEIESDNGNSYFNQQHYANWNIEKGEILPNYIDPLTGRNNLVYEDTLEFVKSGHEKNRGISEYYYQMSLGEFKFTGEVLKDPNTNQPIRIDIRPRAAQSIQELSYSVMDEMYALFPDFDWTKFDQRKNFPNYKQDNSLTGPDGKPDCVVLIYRSHNGMKHQVFNTYRPGWGGGIATSYLSRYESKWEGVSFDNAGYTSSNESAKDIEQLRSFFLHEIGHKLYSAPHYNGANGEIGDYFFYPSNAYGMMNTSSILNSAANGWERWVCGWIDLEDATGKSSDLNEPEELKGQYQFYLEDFVSSGNVIRLKIPNTKDQYLWIENHLNKSTFDESLEPGKKLSKNGELVPFAEKGIYMYIERISSDLSILPRYGRRSDSNGLKLLHADGNWDYDRELTGTKDWGNYHNNPIFTFTRKQRNPIGGTNPFMRYLDDFPSIPSDISSKDGKMKYKNSVHGGYIESVDILQESDWENAYMIYGNFAGRNKEAKEMMNRRNPFFQPGDELSLSSENSLVNLRKYDDKKGIQGPFIPSGLTVRVLEKDANGRVEIQINFADFEIRENNLWTGNITIQPHYLDALKPGLILAEKTTLIVGKSGTANTHLQTEAGDFINESMTELAENSSVELMNRAKWIFKDGSTLVLRKSSTIRLNENAKIYIQDKSKIILEKGARIIYGNGAEIKFEGEQSEILYQ